MTEQQLPAGWQMVKFGDIAKHISKRVEPSETDLEIYVGLEHLNPDSLKIKRHGVPSDVAGQKLLVKKGQIIFGKRRAYQRKVAVADWDCICSAHAMVLEANSERITPEYLAIFMQSNEFMERAIAISEGSLSPTIKWKTLSVQNFCIPPADQQRSIINIHKSSMKALHSIDSAIISNQKLRNSFEDRYFSYTQENSGLARSIGCISDICKVKGGKRLPKGVSLVDVDTGYKYIRVSDMNQFGIEMSEIMYVPNEAVEKISSYRAYAGELYISVAGTLGLVGRIPTGLDGANMTENADMLKDIQIDSDYLLSFIRSKYFSFQVENSMTTSAQPKLAIDKIKRFKLPIYSDPDCKKIAKIVLGLWDVTESLIQKREKITNVMRCTAVPSRS